MTRKQTLEAIKAAGTRGDKQALLDLYTKNRVSYMAALQAYTEGVRFRLFVETRDVNKNGFSPSLSS